MTRVGFVLSLVPLLLSGSFLMVVAFESNDQCPRPPDDTERQKLTEVDGGYGEAIAVHNDTLVIGAPTDRYFSGSVFVYSRIDQGWVEQQRIRSGAGPE